MVIVIHNLLNETERTFKGDRVTISRALDDAYPFLAPLFGPNELREALDYLDSQQYYSVEVVDDKLHPFVDEKYGSKF
jgi:hypothetical protein